MCVCKCEERERIDCIYIFLKMAVNYLIGCMGGNQWVLKLVHKLQGKSLEPLCFKLGSSGEFSGLSGGFGRVSE